MNRYPVASSRDTGPRRRDHIGEGSAACVSQQRDFVQVDAEPNHDFACDRRYQRMRSSPALRCGVRRPLVISAPSGPSTMILLNAAESRELDRISTEKYG